ncbi:hypothetical protein [Treponema sp. UBA3813]|uniref:hypothetical protein n=1 Tax=Treponema sp. UBA3813 TaxID=1947715 RepID=UPI0025F93216|nr:hypothetical protein [Treponema sp. UBA3813]
MTSGQKVAFSLLISVLAFCAFTLVAFSGLFDLLEVNFYQPMVQEIKQKKLEEIGAAQTEYFETLMKRFDAFTMNADVKTYIELRPSDNSVKKRELLRSELVTSTPALTGLRIVDDNGRNVYFSTFTSDIISGRSGITYRNYGGENEISYTSVRALSLVAENSEAVKKCRIIKDGDSNRLIFSIPFYNSRSEFKGSALFYCDAANFSQFLFNRNLIDINGFAALLTSERKNNGEFDGFGGFVFGLPNFGLSSFREQILQKWQQTPEESFWKLAPLAKEGGTVENPKTLCAFSYQQERQDFGFIALLYDEGDLKFPTYIRLLLLATAFVTFYLAVFLVLSFRHDAIVVIKDKVHRYENEFFIGYKKLGTDNPQYLAEQKPVLERRILKNLGRKGEKHASEFKSIFEGYWQEMIASFGGAVTPSVGYFSSVQTPVINKDELKAIVRSSLEDILENGKIQINAASVVTNSATVEVPSSVTENQEINAHEAEEEIQEAEEIEEAESLDEAETVDEIEEIEDVPVAENPESVEEVESVEEINEVEEVPEAESAESEESADEIEEIEDVPVAENTESVEEVESVEEIDEVEEVPEAEDAEEIEEIEEADQVVEEAEELEDVEEAEEIQEAEEIEEAETVDDAEDLEILDEVDESEYRADDLARTLASLPERAPRWDDNDEVELDEDGLSRRLSASELHDIQKLKDVAKSIDELDKGLEELEPFDSSQAEASELKSVGADYYIPHLLDNNISSDDDIYKDEALLEKIEFGVPSSEIVDDNTNDFIAENFTVVQMDFSELDEIDADDKMYEVKQTEDIKENEHFFENPVLQKEETADNNSEEILPETEIISDVEEELPEIKESPEIEEELPEAEELESLEEPEETMPFMFTKIGSVPTEVSELSSDVPDSIVQESDGTFRVTELSPEITAIPLNMEFKKLVDSIMH